ncbi:MAG: hypothetical protein ACOC0J_00995 [Myxococcota bacterium]
MTQDASNEKAVQSEADLDDRILREHERNAHAVLSTEEGRAFIWRILDDIGRIYSLSYTDQNPHHTAFREGRRDLALDILRICQDLDPKLYLLMLQEAQERKTLDIERRNRIRSKTRE